MSQHNILIIGAGIGGLSAAISLLQAGHRVRIIEQVAGFADIGAGIQLSANATKVLHALGVYNALKPLAVKPKRVEAKLFQTADKLFSLPLGVVHNLLYGADYIHCLRSDLHRVLVDRVQQLDADAIIMNTKLARVEQRVIDSQDTKAIAHLANAASIEADLIIAADGVRSVVRRQLFPQHSAKYTGNMAWRGVISTNRLPANFMPTQVTLFAGPNKHVVLYYLNNNKLLNMVAVVESDRTWQTESWTEQAPWQQLKTDFSGWHSMVQQVIDGMKGEPCYRWALFDHPALDNWTQGSITLLGDAAHATLPFFAQGAAMAIEDAWILHRALQQYPTISDALQCYQNSRIQRTAMIQQQSADNGELYHLQSATELKTRFKKQARSKQSIEVVHSVYRYNALTAKL